MAAYRRTAVWIFAALLALVPGVVGHHVELPPTGESFAEAPEPSASPLEIGTLDVHIEASSAPTVGTLRIELDDGTLVRSVEIGGSIVRVEGLEAGPYVVRTSIPGFAPASRAIRLPREDALTLSLEPGARIAGLVTGIDGAPTVARVRVVGSGIWPARFVTSGVDGRFVIEDVPPGIYEVEAARDTTISEARRGLEVHPAENVFVTFHLQEGHALEGQVVARGRPVAGALVSVSTETLSTFSERVYTDAVGAFRIAGLREGDYAVDVRAEGFVPVTGESCTVSLPCRIDLSRGSSLRGRVLGPDREPIEGALVEVIGEARDRTPVALSASSGALDGLLLSSVGTTGTPPGTPALPAGSESLGGLGTTNEVPPLPLVPMDPESLVPSLTSSGSLEPTLAMASTRLVTDAHGEFAVTGLPSGYVEVVARADGFQVGRSARLFVGEGADRDDVELVLREAGRVRGRLLDPLGRPTDGRIEARVEGDPIPRYLTVDGSGRYELDGLGGTVVLTAFVESYAPAESILHAQPGRTEEVDLHVARARPRGTLRVLDPDGTPVANALVRIESLAVGTGQPRTLVSDENGEVEVAALPDEALSVVAEHPSYARSSTSVLDPVGSGAAPQRVDLALGRVVRAELQLRDAWSAEPIPDASVILTCAGFPACRRTARSDAEGLVVAPGLAVGAYVLEVEAPGHERVRRTIQLAAPRRGSTVDLGELTLDPTQVAEGDVVDRFGTAVEGAEVSLAPRARRDGEPAVVDSATTDAHGHFVLHAVPSGALELRVVHVAAGTASLALDVRTDRAPASMVVRLPERSEGAVRTTDQAATASGVAVLLDTNGRVRELIGDAARSAGLLVGDRILDVDGATSQLDRALLGSALVPALIRVERSGHVGWIRVRRERYRAGS